MSMNGETQRKLLKTTCPNTGTQPVVSEDDSVIVLQPEPALVYPCADCAEMHYWMLDPERTRSVVRFDFLASRGYDIAAAINGEPLAVLTGYEDAARITARIDSILSENDEDMP